jgi:hypothetical protein
MQIHTILTHESPDLDATLCIWLLRRFGESRYPAIKTASLMFVPAGMIPDDLHPDQLELERGILAVDTGGGRLDTHAREGVVDPQRQGKAAAQLVAEDLGVATDPALEKVLIILLDCFPGRVLAGRSLSMGNSLPAPRGPPVRSGI